MYPVETVVSASGSYRLTARICRDGENPKHRAVTLGVLA
jgi:hypothetical protein